MNKMRNLPIRMAAIELNSIDNIQVVKVAGIMRRLQNWLKALTNKDYADEIDQIRFDSGAVQGTATELNKRIEELLNAIKDGDVDEYQVALDTVREISNDLVGQLRILNHDVKQNIPELEVNRQESEVSPEKPAEISISKKDEVVENYNREMWKDPKIREEIAKMTQDKIKEAYPDHDVPVSKSINVPIENFKWFGRYLPDRIHLIEGNNDGGRQNIINNTAKLLERETKLSREEAIVLLVNHRDEFFTNLKKAVLHGKLVSYYPAIPEDPSKVKGREPIKFRKIGEMHVTIQTAPFIIPEVNAEVSCVVGLTETVLSRAEPKLILSWCQFGAVSTMGVPSEWKKNYLGETTVPAQIIPEIVQEPIAETISAPMEVKPNVSDKTAKPAKPAKPAKKSKKKKAERIDLLKKLAGIDSTAAPKLSDQFWIQFVQMCNRLGAVPEDLAKVIYSESGFDPHATNVQNGHIIAKGLNQLIKKTAHSLGMSDQEWDNFENVSAETQLPYIEKYFHNVGTAAGVSGKWANAGQLYVANFAPRYIHRADNPNVVLYDANVNQLEYSQNKGLDRNNKGVITAGDLTKTVQKPLPIIIALALDKAKNNLSGIKNDENMEEPQNDFDSLINELYAEPNHGLLETIIRRSYLKNIMPSSNILISVSSLSAPLPITIKFAKSLAYVLDNVIDADVSIHSKNEKIEIQCSVPGSTYAATSAVRALTDCVIDAINIKNSNLHISCLVSPGVKSKYESLGLLG